MADDLEERRRYFRVNDIINLHHKLIDEVNMDKLSHVSNDILSNCSLGTALDVLAKDSRNLLARIERRDQETAEYLKLLDTKIHLIAQAIIIHGEQYFEHDAQEVTLSATGLSFNNDTAIKVGQLLELRILLTSCMAVIVAFARVVQCKDVAKDNPKQPYNICVEYMNLAEDERELLIKHVVKKQMQQLRDKHEK